MTEVSSKILGLTLHGAAWVLWLLIGLSVVSLAIIFERWWFFKRHKVTPAALATDVVALLKQSSSSDDEPPAEDLAAAVEGAKCREKLRLERGLAFLATLGSNGPFIGLFGTVLGIIKAFHDLAAGGASAAGAGATTVMSGISEALVATAVGLMVAIPAVVAFNYFSRRIKVRMSEIDWMAQLALSEVKSELVQNAPARRVAALGQVV